MPEDFLKPCDVDDVVSETCVVLDEKILEYHNHRARAFYLFNKEIDCGVWIVIIPEINYSYSSDSIEHAESTFRIIIDRLIGKELST